LNGNGRWQLKGVGKRPNGEESRKSGVTEAKYKTKEESTPADRATAPRWEKKGANQNGKSTEVRKNKQERGVSYRNTMGDGELDN